jgi:hypothetical protein
VFLVATHLEADPGKRKRISGFSRPYYKKKKKKGRRRRRRRRRRRE